MEKGLSTNLTKELNPKVNMAIRFHVKCRAKGYKLTAVSAEVTNETIDCQKEPQTCGGKKIFYVTQSFWIQTYTDIQYNTIYTIKGSEPVDCITLHKEMGGLWCRCSLQASERQRHFERVISVEDLWEWKWVRWELLACHITLFKSHRVKSCYTSCIVWNHVTQITSCEFMLPQLHRVKSRYTNHIL